METEEKKEKKEKDVRVIAVVAMVRDLIFVSKIQSTGQAVSAPVLVVDSVMALQAALADNPVRLLIVDLGMSSHDSIQAVAAASRHRPRPKVVAFFAHVQPELAEMAARAGADVVVPRSKFSMDLPMILAEYAQDDAKDDSQDDG